MQATNYTTNGQVRVVYQRDDILISAKQQKVITFASILQWTLFILLLVYLYWIIPKGIDIFDEGIALLHANPSQVQIFQPIQPGPLLNLIVDYDQSTMMTYRQLRFMLLLGCTLIFCLSFYSVMQRLPALVDVRTIFIPAVFPCLLTAGLANYVNGPFALHYNHIVYCFIALIMSAALLDRSNSRIGAVSWFLCGFFIVLLAYVKWPAAAAAGFLFLVFRITLGTNYFWLKFGSLLLGLLAGYFTQQYLYELFIDKALPATKAYLQFAENSSTTGMAHSLTSLKGVFSGESYIVTVFKSYFLDARDLLIYLLTGKFVFVLLAGAALAYLSVTTPKLITKASSRGLLWFAIAVTVIILIYEIPRHPYSLIYAGILATAITILIVRIITVQQGELQTNKCLIPPLVLFVSLVFGIVSIVVGEIAPKYQYFVVTGGVVTLFAIIGVGYGKYVIAVLNKKNYEAIAISIALIIAPLAVAFGHDGGFVIHIIYGLTFWVAAIVIIASYFNVSVRSKDVVSYRLISVSITTFLLTSIIVLQVIYNSMFNTYHTPTHLWQQDQSVIRTPKLKGIELDKTNKDFFGTLSAYINKSDNLKAMRPILAIGSYPGWVFALSSFSPVHLWYTNTMSFGFGYHNLSGDMCRNLVDSIPFYGLPSILIPSERTTPARLPDCLREIGYPAKYDLGIQLDWFDYRTMKIVKIDYYLPLD